jgi:hypothetical protein
MDALETRAELGALEQQLIRQAADMAAAVLQSVTIRDPHVHALALSYAEAERLYRMKKRALTVEVAG